MTFQLGKSDVKSITAKITIAEPGDNGVVKNVGKLKVTTKVLPRTEFMQLCRENSDLDLVKKMVTNIEPADSNTEVPELSDKLFDQIFEHEWQFEPIFQFVMDTNNKSFARALKAKN